jgi:hypothetical protein
MKRFQRYFPVYWKPDDEDGAGSPTEHDGSLSDAARVMPDIEALERQQQQPNGNAPPMDDPGAADKGTRERNADGTFKTKAKADDADAAAAKAKDAAKDADGKPPEGEADDEDYLELPPEKDGAEPQRFKVSEVYEGYQKSKTLEAEIADLKTKSATLTPDAEKATEDLITQMGHYRQAVEQFAAMQRGVEPDAALVDPSSDKYNPDLYAQQVQQAQSVKAASEAARGELERVTKAEKEQNERLQVARFQREQAKLKEFWPELMGDEKVQAEVVAEASKTYGITKEDFAQITDSRHFKVLKDALAFRKQQAATQAAVKVVRAKPKLVKGAARSNTNKGAKHAEAAARLQTSGSLDDAADAISGLIH